MESLLKALDVLVGDLTPEQQQKLAELSKTVNPEKLSAKDALRIVDEVGLDIEKLQKNARKARAEYFKATRKPRIGANEPCTCGSGKKYKKCCRMKVAEQKQTSPDPLSLTFSKEGPQMDLNPSTIAPVAKPIESLLSGSSV